MGSQNGVICVLAPAFHDAPKKENLAKSCRIFFFSFLECENGKNIFTKIVKVIPTIIFNPTYYFYILHNQIRSSAMSGRNNFTYLSKFQYGQEKEGSEEDGEEGKAPPVVSSKTSRKREVFACAPGARRTDRALAVPHNFRYACLHALMVQAAAGG